MGIRVDVRIKEGAGIGVAVLVGNGISIEVDVGEEVEERVDVGVGLSGVLVDVGVKVGFGVLVGVGTIVSGLQPTRMPSPKIDILLRNIRRLTSLVIMKLYYNRKIYIDKH